MGASAARVGSTVSGVDVHLVVVPAAPPAPLPHPYAGSVTSGASTVLVEGAAFATVGSPTALDTPHLPAPPGTAFVVPPSGQGSVALGSATVLVKGKPAARVGDTVTTCSEVPTPATVVSGATTVVVG